jgi:hypothetical protein
MVIKCWSGAVPVYVADHRAVNFYEFVKFLNCISFFSGNRLPETVLSDLIRGLKCVVDLFIPDFNQRRPECSDFQQYKSIFNFYRIAVTSKKLD